MGAVIVTAAATAALRLARFNTNIDVVDKRFFQGLPSPAAAARDLSVKLYPALAPQAEAFAPAALTANCRR